MSGPASDDLLPLGHTIHRHASLASTNDEAAASLQILGLATAVAACEAAEELCGIKLDTKWPNDLLCRGKKVGGVIVEAVLREDELQSVVVGIGLNVNTPLESLPSDLRTHATSLSIERGRPVAVDELLSTLLQCLDSLYRPLDTAEILRRWRKRATFFGRRVSVSVGSGHPAPSEERVTGIAEGVDSWGRLLLRMDDGSLTVFDAGNVHIIRG